MVTFDLDPAMRDEIKRTAMLVCFLLWATSIVAQPQQLNFDHLPLVKGLGKRSISAIVQDDLGFIWMGTQDGLLRFDGYDLKIYKSSLRNKNSLSDNNIRAIAKDTLGNLWIGTQGGGLNRFDVRLEQFSHYTNDPNNPNSISGNAVWSVMVDRKGRVWAGTWSNGISVLDPGRQTFIHVGNQLAADPVMAIEEDQNGIIWFGSSGLNRVDPESMTTAAFDSDGPDRISGIRSLLNDRSNQLWIATESSGVFRFDKNTHQFQPHRSVIASSDASASYALLEDKIGNVWIGTNAGIQLYEVASGNTSVFQHDPSNSLSLSNNTVRVLFADRQGSIWIGNEGGGINKVLEKKAFEVYRNNKSDPRSLSHNLIRSLYEDRQQRIWVGTQGGGLNLFDPETKTFERIGTGPGKIQLPSKQISSIYEDQNGIFWIGTWGDGLYRVDFDKQQVTVLTHTAGNNNSLPDDRIQVVYEDRSSAFWVGTENGLSQFDRTTGQWMHFKHDPNNKNSLIGDNIQGQAFVETSDGTLWIGTWFGLNQVSPDRKTIKHYTSDTSSVNSLTNDHVISLHADQSGNLWIGTFGGGLNQLEIATGTITQYTEEDGLPNNTIFGIKEDDDNHLWLSTNNGLSRFSIQNKTFRNYDASEGLQSNEFYWGAAHRNRDGTLLFGGVDGLNIFQPKEIKDNEQVPPIVITDFQIFNKPVPIGPKSILTQSINFTKEITLVYEQAVLSFQFSALNYSFPEKNQFTYMLEPFEDDWNTVGSKRTATYTNLDPGDYVFRVKGSNNDNVWNEEGVSLKITVLPPYWRTWWFYLIVVSTAGLLIYGFVKFREREMKRDKAQLESTLKESLNRANTELAQQKQAVLDEQERNKERTWTDQALSMFGDILSKSKDDVKELSSKVLSALVKHLQVAGGALYVCTETNQQELQLIANFGFEQVRETIAAGSGLVGACYESREVKNLTDIPPGYHRISSGLGMAQPTTVLLVPLKSEEICLGVLELAAFAPLAPYQQAFVEKLAERITTTLHTTLMAQQTATLLAESKAQAEELKVREEELRQNLEELQAIHDDRDRKEAEMRKEMEELRAKLEKGQ